MTLIAALTYVYLTYGIVGIIHTILFLFLVGYIVKRYWKICIPTILVLILIKNRKFVLGVLTTYAITSGSYLYFL
jgi:hypothetical protein